jgi:hypothetical protein
LCYFEEHKNSELIYMLVSYSSQIVMTLLIIINKSSTLCLKKAQRYARGSQGWILILRINL